MNKLFASLVVSIALAAGGVAAPAAAQRAESRAQIDSFRSDQMNARQEMQAGRTMPLRDIERRVVPQMKGSEYLGPEWDPTASAYRLKFIKDGQVTWVDVDARTGKILRIAK